jgi:exoribonuclease-2
MNDLRPGHLDLQATAKQTMVAHGFNPDFPPEVPQQLAEIRAHPPSLAVVNAVRDLRALLWSSIDNDTSKDLDQIEVAERQPDGSVKVMVGIADVDAFVAKGTPIDQHAARETTPRRRPARNRDRVRSRRFRRNQVERRLSRHRAQQSAANLQRRRRMA